MKKNIERSESLHEIIEQINELLDNNKLVNNIIENMDLPKQRLINNLVDKKNLNKLQKLLNELHPADIADILESIPIETRLTVWDLIKTENDGDILIEVSDAVRQTLIADMDSTELLAATEHLEADEIADIASDLPKNVLQDLLENQDIQNRKRLEKALSYPEENCWCAYGF